MCGIAGIFSKTPIQANRIQQSALSIRHRGPDDEGYLLCRQTTCATYKGNDTVSELQNLPHIQTAPESYGALLHRRLSIVDLSVLGHQPMEANGLHLVFNGEIYNHHSLRTELQKHGYQFRSTSDTEVILHAYQHWGTHCVKQFVGMWAFALLDSKQNLLFISRDRFGIKPLYFSYSSQQFAFASELKALKPLMPEKPELNTQAIADYLYYGKIGRSAETFYQQINELQPGQNLYYSTATNQFHLDTYYSLQANESLQLTEKEAVEQYQQLLFRAIDEHTQADVAVGTCLSGGLDSSAIAARMAQIQAKPYHSFTAVFPGQSIDESHFAASVHRHYPQIQAAFTEPNATELWQVLPQMVHHHDGPFNSTSVFSQWKVMELAKKHHIKVVLDGQGADEVLGGYQPFGGAFLLDQIAAFQWFSAYNNLKQMRQNSYPQAQTALLRALYYRMPKFVQQFARQQTRLSLRLMQADFAATHTARDLPDAIQSYKRLSISQIQHSLTGLLHYEDRNSMAHSIESRVPFLDHRLVEFSLRVPSQLLVNQGWSKYLLRRSIETELPADIVWRKKKLGFVTPQAHWLSTLRPQLREFLHSQTSNYVNLQEMLQLIDNQKLSANQLSEFWKTISLLFWLQTS